MFLLGVVGDVVEELGVVDGVVVEGVGVGVERGGVESVEGVVVVVPGGLVGELMLKQEIVVVVVMTVGMVRV